MVTLITAGETNCRRLTPDQAYVVATKGRQLYASATREDAQRFIERFKRRKKYAKS
jgi:hypothetical protein